MRAENELIVVLCTVPGEDAAERIGRGLVEARLAGCVNAIPAVKSYYRWKGEIEVDSEIQLLIKTQRGRFEELAEWIRANHPYEVPEIVALAADRVSESYLRWALEETS
jgi:periplasmic divalent cation tolerance protein